MLSAAFRRTLARPPPCAWRRLATAATTQTAVTDPAVILRPNETQGTSSALQHALTETQTTPSPVLPFMTPIYLTMSTLVPPQEDEPSPSDLLVELDRFIFDHPIRRDILHLCVVHHLDSLRQGTASTKTRGEVRGSGRKIRPQKGTGKARLGDGQSPMLRGGGVAFGPKPRDFSTKLPRKVLQMGMRVALSAKLNEHGLGVVPSLDWPTMKTKDLATRLRDLGWRKTLFVTGQEKIPEGLRRSSNNIFKVGTTTAEELTVYDAVKWPRLILDLQAVEWFERTLAKSARDGTP